MKILPPSLAGAFLLGASTAAANPRPLPFTYTTATQPAGAVELEHQIDLVPLRATATNTGKPTWYLASQHQTEFEVGLTSRLELGLYVSYVPVPTGTLTDAATLTETTGVKQRLRYRLADPGAWPIDVALYGELVENQNEFEIEAKVIVHRELGPLRLAANVTGEREWYWTGVREWVLQPSAGVSFEITPALRPGLEGWLRVEYQDAASATRGFNLGPHAYVGPVMMVAVGNLWWTTGVYARLTQRGHTLEPGDAYGGVWARTMIGIGL